MTLLWPQFYRSCLISSYFNVSFLRNGKQMALSLSLESFLTFKKVNIFVFSPSLSEKAAFVALSINKIPASNRIAFFLASFSEQALSPTQNRKRVWPFPRCPWPSVLGLSPFPKVLPTLSLKGNYFAWVTHGMIVPQGNFQKAFGHGRPTSTRHCFKLFRSISKQSRCLLCRC